MARLISVNVGLSRDIEWRGRRVYTGIWKSPVAGRCMVRRLNIDGDGQGDTSGHGGVFCVVFVFLLVSFCYWQQQLGRSDFVHGLFGENFTVEGLADDTVCIGDRYRIGNALFEVTQPRVTCYRVGIRMDEPRMPALLTSSGRPGFYLRVLEEGDVGAGDEILKVGEASERMTIAQINALLYSPHHAQDLLTRALRIDALSPDWRFSFESLMRCRAARGNAGLRPEAAAHPAAPGFYPVRVAARDPEAAGGGAGAGRGAGGGPGRPAGPGRGVIVRLHPAAAGPPIFRSYSLSGPASTQHYRISVK